jgi:hypothetical protein
MLKTKVLGIFFAFNLYQKTPFCTPFGLLSGLLFFKTQKSKPAM